MLLSRCHTCTYVDQANHNFESRDKLIFWTLDHAGGNDKILHSILPHTSNDQIKRAIILLSLQHQSQ